MNERRARLGLPRAAYKAGAAVLLVLAPAGCPGSLEDPGQFESADSSASTSSGAAGGTTGGTSGGGTCDAPDMIFTTTCGAAGCHNAASAAFAGNLDLVSPGLASRLVNVPANAMPSLFYIDTANPSQSVLLTKLTSTPPFGAQMPYLSTPLSSSQIQCVTEWVDAQASAGSSSTGGDDGGTGSSTSSSSGASSSTSSSSSSGTGSSSGSSSSSSSSGSTSSSSSSSSGSSSGGIPDSGGAVSFATVYAMVLQGNCATHHSGATPSGGLDLSTEATAYTNLTMGSSSATYEVGCNEKYVVAKSPTTSLLYQKVAGGASLPAKCGAQMPKGGTALIAADVTLIEDWIQGGAAP
jgi:cellulose 1,4-beta-cellobiosidase